MKGCPVCEGVLNPVCEIMEEGIEDLKYQRCRECGWDDREAALVDRVEDLELNRPELIYNDDDIYEVIL